MGFGFVATIPYIHIPYTPYYIYYESISAIKVCTQRERERESVYIIDTKHDNT